MEKSYRNIGYFFIAIWLLTLVDFHKTYTVFFPSFTGFHWEGHFHGAVMMSWFALLIVQPFLLCDGGSGCVNRLVPGWPGVSTT